MKLHIGNKLSTVRQDKKMTQIEMAELLKIPESTYARYERNESQVAYQKIATFVELLNVLVQELLPETFSITNNNHNAGQGGGVIFGNQYFYLEDKVSNQALANENQELREKLALLEKKIDELLSKK